MTPLASPSPTADLLASLGETLFQDDFSSDQGWELGEDRQGGTSIIMQHLTIAVNLRGAFRLLESPFLPPQDYYLEVATATEVCGPLDEFGLVVRLNNSGEHYRWTLTCSGEVRALKVLSGGATLLGPVGSRAYAIPGPQGANLLAVRLQGTEIRFFLNGAQIFATQDSSLQSGRFGLFVRSSDENQTTVNFDDMTLRALAPGPSQTSTPPNNEESNAQ